MNRGCAIASRGYAVANRGCAVANRGCAITSRGCAVANRGCAAANRGCAVANRGCARRSAGLDLVEARVGIETLGGRSPELVLIPAHGRPRQRTLEAVDRPRVDARGLHALLHLFDSVAVWFHEPMRHGPARTARDRPDRHPVVLSMFTSDRSYRRHAPGTDRPVASFVTGRAARCGDADRKSAGICLQNRMLFQASRN